MFRNKWLGALALWTALSSGGCTRPAEERALKDLEVGRAEVDGTTLSVDHGLAAIRRAEVGDVLLWQSAPVTTLRVNRASDAPSEWTFTLRNAMPDLTLAARASDKPLSVVSLPQELATHKAFRVELPAGESTLEFAVPPPDPTAPFRFALMSDVQEAIDGVQDIYTKMNAEPGVGFLLGAGDLTQRGTVDELDRFEQELRSLKVPYYTTLGNHELGTTPPPFQDLYGRGNFSFVFQSVRFTMLDSASATLDPIVYDWLDGWLDQGRSDVHVVAMHIAPLDPSGIRNGGFASRAEAAKLLSRLAKGAVDLTLYGHVHSHYEFENAGIPARISGGGGSIPERFDGVGRHFLVIDIGAKAGLQSIRLVRVD